MTDAPDRTVCDGHAYEPDLCTGPIRPCKVTMVGHRLYNDDADPNVTTFHYCPSMIEVDRAQGWTVVPLEAEDQPYNAGGTSVSIDPITGKAKGALEPDHHEVTRLRDERDRWKALAEAAHKHMSQSVDAPT